MKFRKLPYFVLSKLGFYREIRFGVSRAENSGPYYVIRRSNSWGEAGFFSNYFYVLSHYAYALQRGWRPVIDMRNYRTLYSERKPINGESNAWNYYFRQPHSTRDAYKSHRFILSNCTKPQGFNPIQETDSSCDLNPDIAPGLIQMARRDLPLRPEVAERFQQEFGALLGDKKVLGIHYRGGDKHAPPPGHRMSVSRENLLAAVDELLLKEPDAVFIASDEEGVSNLIRERTNIPVVELSACRLPPGSADGLHNQKGGRRRSMHRYLLGLEVLRDAWFLSRCNFLIYGHSNVSNAALFFRGAPYEAKVLVESGAPAGPGKKIGVNR